MKNFNEIKEDIYWNKDNNENTILNIVKKLIKNSTIYYRQSAFFDTKFLTLIGEDILKLVKNKGEIRYLLSPNIDKKIIDSIKEGKKIKQLFTDISSNFFSELLSSNNLNDKLEALKFLSTYDNFKVKISYSKSNEGIMHEKLSIFKDEIESIISLSGSMNETYNGYLKNFETMNLSKGIKAKTYLGIFNEFWENNNGNFETIDITNYAKDFINKTYSKLILKKEKIINISLIDNWKDYFIDKDKIVLKFTKAKYFDYYEYVLFFDEIGANIRLDDVSNNVEIVFNNIKYFLSFYNNYYVNNKKFLEKDLYFDNDITLLVKNIKYQEEMALRLMGNSLHDKEEMNKNKNKEIFLYKIEKNLNDKFDYHRPLKIDQSPAVFLMQKYRFFANFSEPGSGKTQITYDAFFYNENFTVDSVLIIIGNKASIKSWYDEYYRIYSNKKKPNNNKNDYKDIYVISPDYKDKFNYKNYIEEVRFNKPKIIITNYENIKKIINILNFYSEVTVVYDEVHYLKNSIGSWRRKALKISLNHNIKSIFVLTGTPMPKGFLDLINIFKIIWPLTTDLFWNKEDISFETKIVDLQKYYKKKVSPFYTKLTKSELGISDSKIIIHDIEMSKNQKELIEDLIVFSHDSKFSSLLFYYIYMRILNTPEMFTKKNIFKLTKNDYKLKEYNVNEYYLLENESKNLVKYKEHFINTFNFKDHINNKLDAIINTLLTTSGKYIIWYFFKLDFENIAQALDRKKIKYKYINGESNPKERETILEKFNNEDYNDSRILVANIYSISESVSLNKGISKSIYYFRDFNNAIWLQTQDRIHRIGTINQVKHNIYIYNDHLDRRIDHVLNERTKLFKETIVSDKDLLKNKIKNLSLNLFLNDENSDINIKEHIGGIYNEN